MAVEMVYLVAFLLRWRLALPTNKDDKAAKSKTNMAAKYAAELSDLSGRGRGRGEGFN